jgi:hypothetical protein
MTDPNLGFFSSGCCDIVSEEVAMGSFLKDYEDRLQALAGLADLRFMSQGSADSIRR